MGDRTSTFHFTVNGGEEKSVTVETGIYKSAVAAIPAIFGYEDYPLKIKIWVPDLLPDYGPYVYRINEAGGETLIVTEISEEVAQRYRDMGLGHLLSYD